MLEFSYSLCLSLKMLLNQDTSKCIWRQIEIKRTFALLSNKLESSGTNIYIHWTNIIQSVPSASSQVWVIFLHYEIENKIHFGRKCIIINSFYRWTRYPCFPRNCNFRCIFCSNKPRTKVLGLSLLV